MSETLAPNDEFLRKVEEEYRREQMAQIWKRYNGIIIAVVVLIVAGVGGWRFWQHMQETRAQEAAVRYEEALRLSSEDNGQEAQAAFENVVKEDGSTCYAMLARFRLAAELGQAATGALFPNAIGRDSTWVVGQPDGADAELVKGAQDVEDAHRTGADDG